MKKSSFIKSLVVTVLVVFSVDVLACGESLFRIGKGINYRNYFAPLPGKIIVVARTEGELAMVESLAMAGHDVHVVASPELLSEELSEHDFDIVLALYSQRERVADEIADHSAAYIPVALQGSEEVKQARRHYAHSLSTDDSVKQFLKSINKTLKQRQT